ncbi:hypothetical protein E5D57_001922 [Metarhizium anisopliae]|nr:hypothetical protein E5D57_001922 [Metarhizium anisopliae]
MRTREDASHEAGVHSSRAQVKWCSHGIGRDMPRFTHKSKLSNALSEPRASPERCPERTGGRWRGEVSGGSSSNGEEIVVVECSLAGPRFDVVDHLSRPSGNRSTLDQGRRSKPEEQH